MVKKFMRTEARRCLSMNENYLKLVRYVNAASEMAESLTKDIKAGKAISNETVLAVSRFISASSSIQKMLDQVESDKVKLN